MRCRTVLCVDDDAAVRKFYGTLLRQNGYDVISAANGVHALHLFGSKGGQIDAVILDYQMPEMNGLQLAALLKRRNPELPVLMISGCLPPPQDMFPLVDAAIGKGLPIAKILDRLEHVLGSQPVLP